jgi:hypothetical protein
LKKRAFIAATLASAAFSGAAGFAAGCNTGIFAHPRNAGPIACACACGTTGAPDAGAACMSICQQSFDAEERVALELACDGAFDDYSHCLEDEGRCDGRTFDASDCGTERLALTQCEARGSMSSTGP